MAREVLIYGAAVLRQRAKEVPEAEISSFSWLKELLFEVMRREQGVGLAAPQVGEQLRMFVASGELVSDEKWQSFQRVCINPQLLWSSPETCAYEEGCLSIPGIREQIIRPKQVRMSYLDENGNSKQEMFDDFPARVVQHEYDHLEGKLFIDYLSPLKKRLLKGKLNKLKALAK